MNAHFRSTRNVLLLNIPTFENNRLLLPSRLPSEPARNICWRHQLNLLNDRLLPLQRTICKLEMQPKNALVLVLDIQFVLFYLSQDAVLQIKRACRIVNNRNQSIKDVFEKGIDSIGLKPCDIHKRPKKDYFPCCYASLIANTHRIMID